MKRQGSLSQVILHRQFVQGFFHQIRQLLYTFDLLILDNATVNSRHQDPLPVCAHWALYSITVPLAENCVSRSFSWAQGQAHA